MGKIVGRYCLPHPPMLMKALGRELSDLPAETLKGFDAIAQDIVANDPDTIVVLAPHGPTFSNCYNIPDWRKHSGQIQFTHKFIPVSYYNDIDLVHEIIDQSRGMGILAASVEKKYYMTYSLERGLDFSVSVPLYLLGDSVKGRRLVRICMTRNSPDEQYRFGTALRKAVEKSSRNVAIIASAELSHKLHADPRVKESSSKNRYDPQNTGDSYFGYAPEGDQFDQVVLKALRENDVVGLLSVDPELQGAAWECGLATYVVMMGTVKGFTPEINVLSYEHPFGIGYVTAIVKEGSRTKLNVVSEYKKRQNKRVNERKVEESIPALLARSAIEHYLSTGERLALPDGLPDFLLKEKSGVYVSLRRYGQWRGCKGNPLPVGECIAEDIVSVAINAATEDSRFLPLTMEELANCNITVSVLGPLEEIDYKDHSNLDPQRWGLTMRSSMSRWGLVLPRVPEVHTAQEQINAVKNMANFSWFLGDVKIKAYRFETTDYR